MSEDAHARPTRDAPELLYDVSIPTPTHAERARTLVVQISTGTLCTLAVPAEYSVPVVAVAVAGHRLIPFSGSMTALLIALLASLRATTRSRLELAAEILALRHQLAVLHRATRKRPRLRPIDRLLWVVLSTVWPNWRQAVQIVTPATVVRWHRRAFAAYWRWNSRPRRVGRPAAGP